MATITGVPETTPLPRVGISLAGWTDGPVTVTRVHADGNRVAVRSMPDSSGGVSFGYDNETPLGEPFHYEAMSGATLVTGGSVRTNLCTSPNAETASGTVVTRTNLCPNPNAETNVTGWTAEGGAVLTRDTASPISGTASFKLTAGAGAYFTFPVLVGETYTFSFDYTTVGTISGSPSIGLYIPGYTKTNLPLTQVAPGRFSVTATATATATAVAYVAGQASGVFHFDNVLLEKAAVAGTYFDGSTAAAGDYTYAWTGTANASTSTQSAPGVAGWTAGSGALLTRDTASPISGTASFKLTNGGYVGFYFSGVVAGETWTFSLDYTTVGTLTGTPQLYLTLPGTGDTGASLPRTQATPGRFSVTATATASGAASVWIYGPPVGDVIHFDNVLIEKSPTAGTYFEGSLWGDVIVARTDERISIPGMPQLDFQIDMVAVPAAKKSRPTAILDGPFRSMPAGEYGERSSARFAVQLRADSVAERVAVDQVLQQSGVVLIRIPLTEWAATYAMITDDDRDPKVSFRRQGTATDTVADRRTFTLTCVETSSPVGGSYGDPSASYQALLDSGKTYQTLLDWKGTGATVYLDLLRGGF